MEKTLFYRDQTKRLCQILDRAALNGDGREVILYQELFGMFEKKAEYGDLFFSVMEPVTLLSGQSHMLQSAEENGAAEAIPAAECQENGPAASDTPDSLKRQESTAGTRQSSDLLMAFLDAPDGAQKLEILEEMKDCITDYMVDAMAISMDMEISDGVLEDRYQQLIRGLRTKNRYETARRRL